MQPPPDAILPLGTLTRIYGILITRIYGVYCHTYISVINDNTWKYAIHYISQYIKVLYITLSPDVLYITLIREYHIRR